MSNEPNFQIKEEYGGINWGFCQQKSSISYKKYLAEVETSSLENSDTK